jgi:hypothetical protein
MFFGYSEDCGSRALKEEGDVQRMEVMKILHGPDQ